MPEVIITPIPSEPPPPPPPLLRFAKLVNGVVTDVIVATAAPGNDWAACAEASPGWLSSDGLVFAPPPAPAADPRKWWIDVGPFKDRLGVDALAIAASTHDACKASIEMLNGRLYIDLAGPQVAQLLGMLAATLQPAANPIFAGSGPMTALKIASITTTPTTEVERHLKGLT